jgi:hypothetical protein
MILPVSYPLLVFAPAGTKTSNIKTSSTLLPQATGRWLAPGIVSEKPFGANNKEQDLRGGVLQAVLAFGRAVLYSLIVFRFFAQRAKKRKTENGKVAERTQQKAPCEGRPRKSCKEEVLGGGLGRASLSPNSSPFKNRV